MSEHTSISGICEYWHSPYREEGFSYCKHCKDFCEKVSINFNEGFLSDWMTLNCDKCKKTIWVCEFKRDERKDKLYTKQKRGKSEEDLEGVRIFVKDNKKCKICKKPTNHYDAYSVCYTGMDKGDVYLCSKKCEKIHDKKFFKWCKKNSEERLKDETKNNK